MYWLEFAGEDDPLAACEASTAADDVRIHGPGVGLASTLTPKRVTGLAFTRAAGPVVGRTTASIDQARACLRAASLSREGSVAVRARDVRSTAGIDTQRAERELGDVLADRGFAIDLEDPDQTLRVLFGAGPPARDPAAQPTDEYDPIQSGQIEATGSADYCVLGWVSAHSERTYGARQPTDRPFFKPGSMDPLLARALANLGRVEPGTRVLDPMCGTGGLLIEAGLLGARCYGIDADREMVHGTRQNLQAYLETPWAVWQAAAQSLPITTAGVDVALVDVPYGRQSAITAQDLATLVETLCSELARVADRAVVVADQPWITQAQAAGWSVTTLLRRRVHQSLTRVIHVLA